MSLAMLSALCLAAGAAPAAPAEAGRVPNIVLLIADDLGAEDSGPFGNRAVQTPNLDRLARQGLTFERAYVTTSSCSPSRCSMLTGRYPHSHGAPRLHQPLPPGQPSFVAELRRAGAWTALAGKTHLGADALKAFDRVKAGGGPSGCEGWIDTLRARPKDRPFFAWLAAVDPHRDYEPGTIPQPHRPEAVVVPPFLPDTPQTRRDLALYYDEIARLDGYVGQVLEELQRQGIEKETLVLFLSDNGRPFPRCKTTLYESGIRTPLVVRWPGRVPAGATTRALVSTVDLAPTLLELAGVALPPAVQGQSFARVLRDPQAPGRDAAFAEKNWHDFDDHARAVVTARYKYVRNSYTDIPLTPPADAVRSPTFQGMLRGHDAGRLPPEQQACFRTPRPAEELYDLAADPQELHNRANDAACAAALREHRALLERWVRDTADRVPEARTPDGFDRRTGKALPR